MKNNNYLKTLTIIYALIVFFNLDLFSQTVTVQGNALKTGQTNHSGIRVIFHRTSPTVREDTAFTDSTGNFSKVIPTGIYNIYYSRTCAISDTVLTKTLFSNTTLATITLFYSNLEGNIKGVLPIKDYYVGCDITVLANDTLEIQAGTRFYFFNNAGIIGNGRIIANGNVSDSIIFTRYGKNTWNGIYYQKIKNDLFNFISLSYSTNGIYSDGNMVQHIPINITNSRFSNNGKAVSFGPCTYNANINNCYFKNNTIGVYLNQCIITARNCFFDSPINGFLTRNATFISCILLKSTSYTITSCTLNFTNCLFADISGNAFQDTPYNTINSIINIRNSVFFKNSSICSTTLTNITNCLFFDNGNLPTYDPLFNEKIATNINGDSIDIYGNIFLNPMFTNATIKDYHLLLGSHAIDAGDNSSLTDTVDFDNNKRIIDGNGLGQAIIDIGPYEYQGGGSIQPTCSALFTVKIDTLTNVATFSNTTTGLNKYYWNFDDGDFSNATSPIHKYNKDGIYRVSLTATDTTKTCQTKTEQEVKIKTTVVDPCHANFTFTLDTINKTFTFTNTSSSGIDRNYWEFGDGSLSNTKSPIHTYNAAGYYKVSLTVIDTIAICFDIKNIVIKLDEEQKPCKADFTYNVDLTTQNIYFADHSEIPVNTQYTWDFNDGSKSTLVNPEHKYIKGGYYDVCLTINDSTNNCRNTSCQNLKASELPAFCKANFTYSVDTLTSNVNFYDNSKGKHNGWEWNYGDNTTEKNQNGKHKYNPGYYTVRLKITDSETGCISFTVSVINIKEPQKLKSGFGYEKKEGSVKGVLPIEFKGASYGDETEVEWDFGDGETNNTSISPTHDYSEGTYNACLTVSNAYTGETDKSCQQIVVVVTGLEKQTMNNSITIYPNPAKQSVTITYNLMDKVNNIEIVNTIGQTVFAKQIKTTNKTEQLDISSLQQGIYFIKVQIDNGNIIEKIIKQ